MFFRPAVSKNLYWWIRCQQHANRDKFDFFNSPLILKKIVCKSQHVLEAIYVHDRNNPFFAAPFEA